MAKNIIILGAGASAQYGAPVMGNFLDVSSNLLAHNKAGKRTESFKRVFEALASLQRVHSKSELDLVNLESVFTTLELSKTLGRFPGIDDVREIDQRIQDLKWVIVHTLQEQLEFTARIRGGYGSPELGRFIENIAKCSAKDSYNSTAILTFNYDLLLDVAIRYANLGTDYGLAKEPTSDQHFLLLKLHGSLNWAVEKGNGNVKPWFFKEYIHRFPFDKQYGIKPDYRLRIADNFTTLSQSSNIALEETPLIVPPSWNKAAAYAAISDVWKRAADELSEADSIFVVGYSLPETDSFFRQLYALGTVGQTLLKKFWVFNKDATRENIFRSMLGPGARDRFRFFCTDFQSAQKAIETAISEV